jgi:hypothetical protein
LQYMVSAFELPKEVIFHALSRKSVHFIGLAWSAYENEHHAVELLPPDARGEEHAKLLFLAAMDLAFQMDRFKLTASSFPWRGALMLLEDDEELRETTLAMAKREWAVVLAAERDFPHFMKRLTVTTWQAYRELMIVGSLRESASVASGAEGVKLEVGFVAIPQRKSH